MHRKSTFDYRPPYEAVTWCQPFLAEARAEFDAIGASLASRDAGA